MKAWFQALNSREQRIVLIGGISLAILIFYGMVWDPLSTSTTELREEVALQRGDLAWMKGAAEEVKRQGASGKPGKQQGRGESLLTLVDRTAKQNRLGDAVKRVQPDKDGQVRIWLENASFDDMLRWLSMLSKDYGVTVLNTNIEGQPDAGQVNARLVVRGGGQ